VLHEHVLQCASHIRKVILVWPEVLHVRKIPRKSHANVATKVCVCACVRVCVCVLFLCVCVYGGVCVRWSMKRKWWTMPSTGGRCASARNRIIVWGVAKSKKDMLIEESAHGAVRGDLTMLLKLGRQLQQRHHQRARAERRSSRLAANPFRS
jgi:hypothetical protein